MLILLCLQEIINLYFLKHSNAIDTRDPYLNNSLFYERSLINGLNSKLQLKMFLNSVSLYIKIKFDKDIYRKTGGY